MADERHPEDHPTANDSSRRRGRKDPPRPSGPGERGKPEDPGGTGGQGAGTTSQGSIGPDKP